jgi:hypothetical protein
MDLLLTVTHTRAAVEWLPVLIAVRTKCSRTCSEQQQAQVQWGQSNVLEFDLKRTLRNGLIGALFGPVVRSF